MAWTDYVTYDLNNLGAYGLENPTVITVDYQQEEEADGSDTESSDDSAEETADDSTKDDTEEDSTVTVDKQMVMLVGSQTEDGNYYYGKLQDNSCIYTIGSSTIQNINRYEESRFSQYKSSRLFLCGS